MKVIKRYRVFLFEETRINQDVIAQFTMHRDGYINETNYSDRFDTEEEAIQFCYDTAKFKHWIIVPEITFDNF